MILRALLASILATGTGWAAEAPAGCVSETLPNGLRVSILPDPSLPVVATQVWYHVGAAHEDEGSRGLAHLFEHLMFGETPTRGKEDYSQYHTVHGGYENAYTSLDETVYVSDLPPEAHLPVLEMEADRMAHLVLDQENLDNEKKIVTEELRLRTENSPETRLLVAAQRALLGDHPYAVDPSGTKENIAAATVESCKKFYGDYYHPNHAHLVVVGPVDADKTMQEVRERFGPLPGGGKDPREVEPLYGRAFPEETELSEDLPPVETAILGFPLPPPDSEDGTVLEVLSQLLAFGEVTPFREELVTKRGKAIEAGTEVLSFRRGGALVFYSVSLPYRRKATAFRLMSETRDTLSALLWLTEESLASAKRTMLRRELLETYDASSRASDIGQAAWWLGDERRAFDRPDRIRRVTREQVAAAYRKYVGDAKPVKLYFLPEKVPILVRLFGWVYPLVHR